MKMKFHSVMFINNFHFEWKKKKKEKNIKKYANGVDPQNNRPPGINNRISAFDMTAFRKLVTNIGEHYSPIIGGDTKITLKIRLQVGCYKWI